MERKKKRYEHILGSNIDKIVRNAICEITLVKAGINPIKDILVLVGTGLNSILAVQRALEISKSIEGSSIKLLTVKSLDSSGYDPQVKGKNLIETTVRTLGLNPDDFNSEVVVADDVRSALMESIKGYDTVCIGATRSTSVRKALFGSIPEEIGENTDGTVAPMGRS